MPQNHDRIEKKKINTRSPSSATRCTTRVDCHGPGSSTRRTRASPPRRGHKRSYTSPNLVINLASLGISTENDDEEDRERSASSECDHLRKTFAEATETTTSPTKGEVEVFLGGSCNPTTWRKDIALPLFNESEVTYFNPQVEEWYPALMEIERRVKESAKIVLMVIDDLTRSIVCINEAVEYICRGRRVVLVVEDMIPGVVVDGKALGAAELADLNGARACLRNLARKKSVRLYDDVHSAVYGIVSWLRDEEMDSFRPDMPRLRKRSSIILNEWATQLRPRRAKSRSCSSTSIVSIIASSQAVHSSDDGSSDDDSGREEKIAEEVGQAATTSSTSFVRHLGVSSRARLFKKEFVYLGGNLQATSWREIVAIPLLQQAGIPFYVPYEDYLSRELRRFSSISSSDTSSPLLRPSGISSGGRKLLHDAEAQRDLAQLILFVIPNNSRSIAAMTEAVELASSHRAMLLVIEELEEGCVVEDSSVLTGREFKDLARARSYLRETAARNDVNVFSCVQDAVNSIVERL